MTEEKPPKEAGDAKRDFEATGEGEELSAMDRYARNTLADLERSSSPRMWDMKRSHSDIPKGPDVQTRKQDWEMCGFAGCVNSWLQGERPTDLLVEDCEDMIAAIDSWVEQAATLSFGGEAEDLDELLTEDDEINQSIANPERKAFIRDLAEGLLATVAALETTHGTADVTRSEKENSLQSRFQGRKRRTLHSAIVLGTPTI